VQAVYLSHPKTTRNFLAGWILWGIPVLFAVGGLTHFLYEWSGNQIFAGLFTPVNESVWEHLKMSFWPNLLWWLLGYLLFFKKVRIQPAQWILSCGVSLIVAPLVIVSFFYTYTGALGIESLALDIFSLFLGLAAAQVLAYYTYKNVNCSLSCLILSVIVIGLLAAAFLLFTFDPPHLPLFLDMASGRYGI
jgi:hypothetical protein